MADDVYQLGETAIPRATFRDGTTLTDPDTSIQITITDPNGTAVVDDQAGTQLSTGIYQYFYDIPSGATSGLYKYV